MTPEGNPDDPPLHSVRIPTVLRGYTAGTSRVSAGGSTVDEVIRQLDSMFPGLRFRVVDEQDRLRPHMKVFLGDEAVRDLDARVEPGVEVTLMQALSGG